MMSWYTFIDILVALFTRAWIEIILSKKSSVYPFVALFTRAWIEIYGQIYGVVCARVALFTRAWIEIEPITVRDDNRQGRPLHEGVDWNKSTLSCILVCVMSPSSRGRGLKYNLGFEMSFLLPSPSSRGRGLKSFIAQTNKSFAGRPLHEGVDWNNIFKFRHIYNIGRPLHEGVDWNFLGDLAVLQDLVALFTRAWIEIHRYVII